MELWPPVASELQEEGKCFGAYMQLDTNIYQAYICFEAISRLLTLHVSNLILCVKIAYFKSCPCTVQVLEGAEGQYSGMQIGQLQDEEDEAANILQDNSSESFRNSSLGMSVNTGVGQTGDTIKRGVQVHLHFRGSEDSCNRYEKQLDGYVK